MTKEKIIKPNLEERLSSEEYYVTQNKGTEPAFSGKYNDTKTEGNYNCVCCGETLFTSKEKYDSGTGWPSFWQSADELSIGTEKDYSAGMERVEVHCKKCDAHLGHVFQDGPEPSGLRYCINSLSLHLDTEKKEED